MPTTPTVTPSRSSWIRATWAGWLLGLLLVILLAFAADAIGLDGTQSFVAVGMSLGVSLVQRKQVAPIVDGRRWVGVTVSCVAAPFVVADVFGAIGFGSVYSLPLSAGLGGVLAGWVQAPHLNACPSQPRWAIATGIGWLLGASTGALAQVIFTSKALVGLPGAIAYLGVLALGGLILGASTAIPLGSKLAASP